MEDIVITQRHVDVVNSAVAVFTSMVIGCVIGFSYGYALGSGVEEFSLLKKYLIS